jgi:hypothetical protein
MIYLIAGVIVLFVVVVLVMGCVAILSGAGDKEPPSEKVPNGSAAKVQEVPRGFPSSGASSRNIFPAAQNGKDEKPWASSRRTSSANPVKQENDPTRSDPPHARKPDDDILPVPLALIVAAAVISDNASQPERSDPAPSPSHDSGPSSHDSSSHDSGGSSSFGSE